jgi:hypothetical protein
MDRCLGISVTKNMSIKKGRGCNMELNWKDNAEVLFFNDGKRIPDISKEIGISQRSISGYLNSLPHYDDEVERRKQANRLAQKERDRKRKQLNRKWQREHLHYIDAKLLKQNHETAVNILSRERFYNDY